MFKESADITFEKGIGLDEKIKIGYLFTPYTFMIGKLWNKKIEYLFYLYKK